MAVENRRGRAPGDYIRDTQTKGTRSVMKYLFALFAALFLGVILFSYVLAPMFSADDPTKRTSVTTPT